MKIEIDTEDLSTWSTIIRIATRIAVSGAQEYNDKALEIISVELDGVWGEIDSAVRRAKEPADAEVSSHA